MRLVPIGHQLINPEYVTRIRHDANYGGTTIYMVDSTNIWLSCPQNVSSRKAWCNKVVDDLS
jgi:hypothetical protein